MSRGLAKGLVVACACVAVAALVSIILDPGDIGPWLTLLGMILTSVAPVRALLASPPER